MSRGILEKPMIIKELIKEMRTQGVDIFPDYDSHCYIEGNTDMQKVLKRKPNIIKDEADTFMCLRYDRSGPSLKQTKCSVVILMSMSTVENLRHTCIGVE